MSTLDWIRNVAVTTAEEAIKLMFEQGKRSIVLYNSSSKTLSDEIRKFYEAVKDPYLRSPKGSLMKGHHIANYTMTCVQYH